MKCPQQTERLAMYVYDELDAPARFEMDQHLATCPVCHQAMAELRRMQQVDREAGAATPTPDWDMLWQRIDHDVQRRLRPAPTWQFRPAWAMAAAALLVVFILGIWFGGHWARRDERPAQQAGIPFQATLTGYFDSVQTALTDYDHSTGPDSPLSDRSVVERLLINQRLLKKRAQLNHDGVLLQFLTDLEIVLLEIANASPQDLDKKQQIQEMIDRQGLHLKLKLYKPRPKAGTPIKEV
jgi:hypothetical protein